MAVFRPVRPGMRQIVRKIWKTGRQAPFSRFHAHFQHTFAAWDACSCEKYRFAWHNADFCAFPNVLRRCMPALPIIYTPFSIRTSGFRLRRALAPIVWNPLLTAFILSVLPRCLDWGSTDRRIQHSVDSWQNTRDRRPLNIHTLLFLSIHNADWC